MIDCWKGPSTNVLNWLCWFAIRLKYKNLKKLIPIRSWVCGTEYYGIGLSLSTCTLSIAGNFVTHHFRTNLCPKSIKAAYTRKTQIENSIEIIEFLKEKNRCHHRSKISEFLWVYSKFLQNPNPQLDGQLLQKCIFQISKTLNLQSFSQLFVKGIFSRCSLMEESWLVRPPHCRAHI